MIICTLQHTGDPDHEFFRYYPDTLKEDQQVAVLSNETEDNNPEHQYYTVADKQGNVYGGMSGVHLKGIEAWRNEQA